MTTFGKGNMWKYFYSDRVKPDESMKEKEEQRIYRLIPRTFANWLQAFAILASVIGEKPPENCSASFVIWTRLGRHIGCIVVWVGSVMTSSFTSRKPLGPLFIGITRILASR